MEEIFREELTLKEKIIYKLFKKEITKMIDIVRIDVVNKFIV